MRSIFSLCLVLTALSGCSTTGDDVTTGAVAAKSAAKSNFEMEVTDIDFGSTTSDQRYLVSYSFPDARGNFAVRSTGQGGVIEPIADTSDINGVNDDVASSIICQDGLKKLQSKPVYVVADRAYETIYTCNSV